MYSKSVIESIKEISEKYINNKITILTESDFKVLLTNQIRGKFSNNITVNTESPWYDTYESNKTYYVDITAFDQLKLQITYNPKLNRKGYKYEDEALAIELKYFRYKEDIKEIAKDFSKTRLLIKAPKNECFIIALARNIEIFDESKIFMEKQMIKYRNEFTKRGVLVYLIGPEKIIEIK